MIGRSISVRDLEADKELPQFKGVQLPEWMDAVVWSPDGRHFVTGGPRGEGMVWDLATGQKVTSHVGYEGGIQALAYSADGKYVAGAGGRSKPGAPPDADGNPQAEGTAIRIYEALTGKLVGRLTGHKQPITALAFAADGKHLLSASRQERCAYVWDLAKGTMLRQVKFRSVHGGMAFSPNGREVAVVGTDWAWHVYDLEKGGEAVRRSERHPAPASVLAWSRDGRFLVSGTSLLRLQGPDVGCEIHVWDAATGQERMRLQGHINSVHTLTLSPDSKRIVSASADGTVRVWETAPPAGTPPK
jgi:WD40 repeat protein